MRRGRRIQLVRVSEVQRATIGYPGGLSARYRWGGSGSAEDVFALSERGGALTDHVPLAGGDPTRMCRAELRIEGPLGAWTARFASPVFDEPAGLLWDTQMQLVVKYGFRVYGLAARTGELLWSHLSGTPIVAVLGSPRLEHVIVQSEVETVALDAAGDTRWRVAQSDVIASAELVGGTLTLTSYGGDVAAIDPVTGRSLR
ncbi:MAG: PQQ-binding-like beta-propeller repeat protein [Chloroflexota bacterium]